MIHNKLEKIETICDPRGNRKKWLFESMEAGLLIVHDRE